MLRNLIRLAVFLLIANALYRFVPVYMHHYQFKDAVADAARFSKDLPDSELIDRVMILSERYQIPLSREAVEVTRDRQRTYINLVYEEQIEWIPSVKRRMPFNISVEGWR